MSRFTSHDLQIYRCRGTDRLAGPRTLSWTPDRVKDGLPEVGVLIVVQADHEQRPPEGLGFETVLGFEVVLGFNRVQVVSGVRDVLGSEVSRGAE